MAKKSKKTNKKEQAEVAVADTPKAPVVDEGVSEKALARKAAFVAAKEQAGGAESLWIQQKNKPWSVYFNEAGDILCFTNETQATLNEEWLTHDFTSEQLGMLHGKDLTKYRIRKEETEENVYVIELKPIETVYVSAKEDFLFAVEDNGARKWDLQLEVHKDDVVVKLGKAQLEKYKDVYPISATVNGQRLIKIFITATNDPHTMFHYQVIALADLLSNNGEVKFEVDIDFREYSFYTNKLFDTYSKKTM